MELYFVVACLLAIIGLYFYNNPLQHGGWFLTRRFINWFPLGMTYAFLYMGRYNLQVSKNALGTLMTKEDFGIIFGAGTFVYAFSFLVNGPLVDKIGGKLGIIIAAVGSSLANILMGVLTYLVVTDQLKMNLVLPYSVIYALNMYFQSYGAVSIIKVKAYWFHVRERGVFGAIFGTLISFGVYFAFDWGRAIVEMTRFTPTGEGGWLHRFVRGVFAIEGKPLDATWAVFFIPAAIMLFWALLDWWLIRDTPEEAGFAHFDTHDASSGEMHVKLTTLDLLKKVFTSPLMLLIAAIELTSGVMRNGIIQWYTIFTAEIPQPGAEYFQKNWGFLLCIFGIVGGFMGGLMSDKFFQSRRGPPAALLCGLMFLLTVTMSVSLFRSPVVVALAALLISMAVIGVHSLMSGTAAADFGGRKATATCSGIVDGFVYLGSTIQSIGIGFLTPQEHKIQSVTGVALSLSELSGRSWLWWPVFLMPFALIGTLIAWKIWHELPAATRRYIERVERADPGGTPV
ncbi:MAG TPA: MFS transporter [Verrucomicrobiae bacterium]|nr:MFS transporter [Verrucomicrobiae bacterium]